MTKILSYSLFGDPNSFEFPFYLRGTYFNARMNRILYPEFTTVINIDSIINAKYKFLLLDLGELTGILISKYTHDQRCKSMLQRMFPIFAETSDSITHVICRDLDSVSTYREALCTYEWLNSGMPYHAINDNDAHGGLMGGLVAFRSEDFKRDTGYTSFEQMVRGQNLSKHGSDQDFMNKHIHPKIKKGLMMHKLKGAGIEAAVTKTEVPKVGPVDKRYQHADLISRYIGSAGVIDFELLRWFKTHDQNPNFDAFERKFKDIFYWAE